MHCTAADEICAPCLQAAGKLLSRGVPLVEYVELNGTHITLYEQPELVPTMIRFLRSHVPISVQSQDK